MDTGREAQGGAAGNPAAAADAEQHARQNIAAVQGRLQSRARHTVRWLALAAGTVSGWLTGRARREGLTRKD